MVKPGKISFKTYLNDRLKKVNLHGYLTYPLYVQLTYARQTIFFKSKMLELFAEPRFGTDTSKNRRCPSIQFITKKENSLLEFIVKKLEADFSLATFQTAYNFYSTDLCAIAENSYRTFLLKLLTERDLLSLANVLTINSTSLTLFDVLMDLEKVCIQSLKAEINSDEAPPYILLYRFMYEWKKWPDKVLTINEWQQPETRNAFSLFMQKYSEEESQLARGKIEELLTAYSKTL